MKTSTTTRSHKFSGVLAAALWLVIWQVAYFAVGEDLLLASPAAVFLRCLSLLAEPLFWSVVGGSLGRILSGFLLGLLLGSLIALATAHSQFAYRFFSLPLGVVKAAPVASFVILALLWVGKENLSAFIAFLMVLPMVWSNVHEGIVRTDPKLLEMAQVYRLSKTTVLRRITLPSVLPYFFSAAKVGLGFSWKAGIAGEVIAIPPASIGMQLYNAKIYLETTDLFAWTAIIIVLSVTLEWLMVAGIGAAAARISSAVGQEAAG